MDTVTRLTNQLVESYARVGGINHLDGKNLPSKTAMAGITLDLHFRNERIERQQRATPAGPVPVISISEAQAKVYVRDREAILLVGLASGNARRTMPDLLFPKDLPVPGSLSRRGTAGRELLIIVRPTLMAQ